MNTKMELEAQVKELENKLSEVKATINKMKEEKKSFKRWRAERGLEYYTINYYNEVSMIRDVNDEFNNARYNLGNYYKTKEEAERARDLHLAIVRVNDAIMEANEEFKGGEYYSIIYRFGKFVTNLEMDIIKTSNVINKISSKEIAERIISEHSEDLNLIFNVK